MATSTRSNKCPRCGRSRGSMTHRVKCLGKSRGVERAKARLAAASRRGHRRGRGGLMTFGYNSDAGISASASYYERKPEQPQEVQS